MMVLVQSQQVPHVIYDFVGSESAGDTCNL